MASNACHWGFTPDPDCDNCDGSGTFSTDEHGNPEEPCAFCLEDAIRRGELDGEIDGVSYVGGIAADNLPR